MADPRLDNFLKQWAEHEALGDAGKDCPAVSVLWLHATQDQPLGEHEAHVQDCARCRKRLDLIHSELEASAPVLVGDTVTSQRAAGFPSGLSLRVEDSLRDLPGEKIAPTRRFPIVWLTGALAAAACLTLLVLNWQQESTDSERFAPQIALLFSAPDPQGAPIFRGPNDAPPTTPGDSGGWLQALLDDEQAEEALSDLVFSGQILLQGQQTGRIVVIDGRPTIAPHAGLAPAKRERLARQLKADDDACERIVDALIRHLPDATENDRADLRRALDRWRAKKVFGINP